MQTPSHRPPFIPADEPLELIYSGPIRDGRFGQCSSRSYEVWRAARQGTAYLDPFPVVDYSGDAYRVAVNESAAIEQYFALHDGQQAGYFALLQPFLNRGATVMDCGCGGGALLDLVRGFAGRSIGVEPFEGYHAPLRSRGHAVYADLSAAAAAEAGQVDLALSIHVIEHTADPVEYLRAIGALLRPGGILVVLTPNLDDILMKLDFARSAPFFFRKVHNYYFTAASLAGVAGLAGLAVVKPVFYHEFGLANTLLWLRDGRPSGHGRAAGIDPLADGFWKAYLENSGQANQVGVILRK